MLAILILAGRSKRMWPLQEKSFFPVAGTSLIREQVRRLRSAGIRDIILVAGKHNRAEAHAAFPDLSLVEQENLDMGMRGALLSALPECRQRSILVVSANDLVEARAYQDLIACSTLPGVSGCLLSSRVSSYFPGGYMVVEGKRIVEIVEKPGAGREPSDLVNIVAHVHNDPPALLKALQSAAPTRDDGYELALATVFRQHVYHAVAYDGLWRTVKYPWHLLDLLDVLLRSAGDPVIDPSASIHPTAVVEGPVTLASGVRVFPHATIRGPCFVGANTIVANNALVRGSSVGENCVIGYNTEVARSVLAHDVWTHSSYIGDSIIGSNVSFGAGSVTGNLRLDEAEISSSVLGESVSTKRTKLGAVIGSGCRMGIHTCISPGIKLGEHSFVSSMTLVTEDVPERSFVKMVDGKLLIRKNRCQEVSSNDRGTFRRSL